METKYKHLLELLAEIKDLNAASALLGWDQQVFMPPQSAQTRAMQLSTLAKLSHEKFITDEIGGLLSELKGWADTKGYDSDEASLIRVVKRDYDKAKKVPTELITEITKTTSIAYEYWVESRKKSDYSIFSPHLEKIISLNIRLADCLGYKENRYDALIDQFEPELKTSQIEKIFTVLKLELIPIIGKIKENRDTVSDKMLCGEFDEQKQLQFSNELLKTIGFDFNCGRIDKSVHPFTTSFSSKDVRITTRFDTKFLPTSIFGTIHECGHALYDMGINPSLERTPLCEGTSLGIHESQSRLWENIIGRSYNFWYHFYPKLQSIFKEQFDNVPMFTFYKGVNKSAPSLIRVESDEVTYNMHIFLRFELENLFINEKLKVSDAPAMWAEKMKTYLGITPKTDSEGILQDIHWSLGSIGYFPTYTIGNIVASQLYDKMKKDMPDIEKDIYSGKFIEILSWLRKNIHQHGRKFTLNELVTRITGSELDSTPYLNYIKSKFTQIYKL